MHIDLHVHTSRRSSDSSLTPLELIQESKRINLDGVCLTEHGGPWDPHEFQRFASQHDLLLIRALEVETEMGHVTVFGVDGYRAGMHKVRDLRRHVDAAGGFMVTAHPFRALFDSPLRRSLLYPDGQSVPADAKQAAEHPLFQVVDAIEVANGGNTEQENAFALQVAELLGKPGVGGSDAHSVHGLGTCVTVFDGDIRNEAEFLEGLRAGQFRPARDLHIGAVRPFTTRHVP